MPVMKATKKPVTIEFVQWTGNTTSYIDVCEFIGDSFLGINGKFDAGYEIIIKTLEGQHIASIGDYIIKGVKGEFYPCKPDIFKATYDVVQDLIDIPLDPTINRYAPTALVTDYDDEEMGVYQNQVDPQPDINMEEIDTSKPVFGRQCLSCGRELEPVGSLMLCPSRCIVIS